VTIEIPDPSGRTMFSINITDLIKSFVTPKASDPEKEFFDVFSYLKSNRHQLAHLAMQYYQLKNPRSLIRPIAGVNLLGEKSWIPESGPIDLQLGNSELLELDFTTKQPPQNALVHTNYLPWGWRYVENIVEINKKIIDSHKLPEYLNPRLFNAPIYQLVDFRNLNGRFTFTCCRNDYYNYMDNCELLHFEFARAIWRSFVVKGKSPKVSKAMGRTMDFRSKVNIFEFQNRCTGIGINTLLIMKDRNNVTFLKHKRTPGATMEAIDTEHVVPAGTFQPRREMPPVPDPDFNIYKTILRELGEELLGKKEMEEIGRSTEDISKDRHIRKFHKLFVEGYAKAFFLGWGLDPLTTKAEFLTVIVMDIHEFRKRFGEPHFKHNWEGRHDSFPFDAETVNDFIDGPYTLPAGAGCAKLAWDNRELLLSSVTQ
jgi:hypothetical protein